MPRFRQIAELLRLMSQKERIRNVAIVAHIDHGKTTLTDSLLASAGLLSPQMAGTARALDYLEEEQRRGITIKIANISLLHETDAKSYVINLVDTPGHVDFTGKVTRAMRAIDGVVVVIDAVEEVKAQTETVVRQALEERVKPILFINKVDRLVTELQLSPENIQNRFTHIMDNFNNLVEIFAEPRFSRKWKVKAIEDSVAFGSALHKWGFTLGMMRQKKRKFADIVDAYCEDKHQTLPKLLPLSDAILDMIVRNCPSPVEAQPYRIPRIWKGRSDSNAGRAMLECDDKGPTVICLTNAQINSAGKTVVTGRLFSGTVKRGDQVCLVEAGKEATVEQVALHMSAFTEAVPQITAGNVAVLSGLEAARAAETLVDLAHREGMTPFERTQHAAEAVITVTVEPKNPENLPQLNEALRHLTVEDPELTFAVNERTGEHLLSGMGELHLEIALKSLKSHAGGIEIVTSSPMVDYREGIAEKGSAAMARSPNKHNAFWVQVEPLEDKKTEKGLASDEHGNVLVDKAQTDRFPDEARRAVISGFLWACKTGPLCEYPLVNVKAKLLDAQIHEDPKLREPTQIMRAVSRATLGSFLSGEPLLLEPFFKIEVSVPTQLMGTCTNTITRRRGKIRSTETRGQLTTITGYMPVAETLGLSDELRFATSGHAFWQCTFDHWEKLPEGIADKTVAEIRIKKGLPSEVPEPDKFVDEIKKGRT